MARVEQIDRHERTGAYKRFLKKKAKRLRRRAEKRDPENAPRRVRDVTLGYSS